MADPNRDSPPLEDVLYMLHHVFLPPKLPQEDDTKVEHDIALCDLAHHASLEFARFLPNNEERQWSFVSNMLEKLLQTTTNPDQGLLQQNILGLCEGEFLALRIRAQNAALIIRRREDTMTFESFEVQPLPESVMQTKGKLICSYPGPAVELPLDVAHDSAFVEQLVSFLVQMDIDELPGAQATTVKAGSEVPETRSTAHPRYITQLLSMILLGMGKEAQVKRIAKRIADEVCWKDARDPWRRSPLWLVIRVAIQTTLNSPDTYKQFMIFLQMKLLRLFLDYDLPSELLYVTRIKTSRRVYKLGNAASPLLDSMKMLCEEIQDCLQKRWSAEQEQQAHSPLYTPAPSDFETHTALSLDASRAYLTEVMSPNTYTQPPALFHPSHHPRIRDTSDFHKLCPDNLTDAAHEDPYLALADFEWLVQERLDDWVIANKSHESACQTLESCLEQYIAAIETHYSSSPEDESLMLLTVMELWVALDTIAVVKFPLLLLYSPEIPASFLDPLLLRKSRSFERAARIQVYLRRRHSGITCTTSIYSDQLSESTFSVRYFEQASALKVIKTSIEQDASTKREDKRAELLTMNKRHAELTEEIKNLDCNFSWQGHHHHWNCYKCKLQKKADRLRISVHEWPLPKRPLEAKAIVFELNCPPVFAIWRRWTYHILRDIGMLRVDAESKFAPNELLERYSPLAAWLRDGRTGRITFASEAKSFLKAHYHDIRLPAREDQVCVNNGLHFHLYDTAKRELVHSTFAVDLEPYCTLRLHGNGEQLYRGLQYAITHTAHPHNTTIVNQGDCPPNLSMHEQLAFSNLRCGSRLQWLNIARELRTDVLTFSREEVHTLLMQTAWQIGPLADDGSTREWHVELELREFGDVLIRESQYFLSHVETNWMEGTTVKSIIYLISRLLSSAKDKLVQNGACLLLRKAREVTYKWMRDILDKLQITVDEDQANELQRRACEMAAICRATFDVDPSDLDTLLCLENDIAILIESTIVVHDNTPPHLGNTFPDFQKLLHRDRRLSYVLEKHLETLIRIDLFKRGMDIAIGRVWPGYHSGVGWQQLAKQNSRWVKTSTAPLFPERAQQVQYNVLDGTLLVDGKQLGRLTREIIEHPTYRRVFGQKILDVIPTGMPGMDYATRSTVYDYEVFFSLRGTNLVIRAKQKSPSNRELELIPHHILREDFPRLFSTEYVHWMDVNSGVVEFRPLEHLWEESQQNPHFNFSKNGPSKFVFNGSGKCLLIDIRTSTFMGIAARLLPLEYSEYLTVMYDSEVHPGNISIDLPRLRLSFFLSDGEIESKNMQGMVIDSDQCTGTMIGLRNQLVLRNRDAISADLPRSRCVLIPSGEVHYSLSRDKNHVRVHIDTRTNFKRRVPWYRYEIDDDLGLLVSNVSLTGRLLRIYLHALCGHPLPDPLTRQRGTDHALQELRGAASFSFQQVTDADLRLLQLIGSITPTRHYYPRHLQSMQTTEWSTNLPAISQHAEFDVTARRILHYAQSLTIFSKAKMDLEPSYGLPSLLMARAAERNAVYYEEWVESSVDMEYPFRDLPHTNPYDHHGVEALKTSRLVYAWPGGLTRRLGSSELLDIFKGWSHMSGPTHHISLSYTKEWLGLDLSTSWLGIYDLCRKGSIKKFELVFSFAALAYSTPDPQRYITLLLAFAAIPRSCFIPPPPHPLYHLADGFEPLRDRVNRAIVLGRIEIMDSPSGQLIQEENESNNNFRRRRLNSYTEATEHKINRAVDYLLNQWCCCIPQSPFCAIDDPEWFKTEKIMDEVTEYFTSCSHNKDLELFTSQITAALQSNYVDLLTPVGEISRFYFTPMTDTSNDQSDSTPTLESLFRNRSTPVPRPSNQDSESGVEEPAKFRELGKPLGTLNVEKLISQFQQNCCSNFSKAYSERLEDSRMKLDGQQTTLLPRNMPPISVCLEYRDQCRRHLDDIFSSFRSAMSPSSTIEEILMLSGLWPSIHRRALLSRLASTTKIRPTAEWVENLTNFAGLFISYQYSQRLLSYAHRLEIDNFYKELQNASFSWSDARKNPDWLLIQIQGNFIARTVQSEIAHEMVAPSSGHNTVLQLNMGEGKSHVIVPLVTVALADSQKLVRVVVSKPLAGQMFHLLAERISGLTNRRVFYLPFSRDVKVNTEHLRCIRELFEDCARVQGVLVAQPEHILSFRLMVIDRLLTAASPFDQNVQDLQRMQEWLTSASRDVLDESDELLHVRYQLIYTMGEHQSFDGGPDRWIITQKLLDLVRHHMSQLHANFSKEVELLSSVKDFEGGFPHVRLLGRVASDELVSQIAEDVVDGKLGNLTFVGLRPGSVLRGAILAFMKEGRVSDETYQIVERTYGQSGQWKGLLLLRGLLAHGILAYVLSRQRWRVDYGLDLGRSLLAVPYRAKDMPSLRSEFGHPDVAICLTCLSYYYGGLTFSQVQESFDILAKLDNPPLEYENWVKRGGNDIPESLRRLTGVNTKDIQTFTSFVFPKFRHNQATIDFFLSHVVFPKEAKEFALKLGTSGWDLAEKKVNVTTGFSGTNDNSDLLPTSITPADTAKQLATNAQVLDYLLRPENERYICARNHNGQPRSVKEFLEMLIQEPREIRVLLDVGAQMLEMTNQQLVTHWLKSTKAEVAAGVFFDDKDQLSVISRDGVVEQLYSSPFYQRLNECIIYLDDAHTRGTDLKLPVNYRAAVTLGPKVTKDRLVQGCMRMRKLGHGQSIVFCAPPEVDRHIRGTQKVGELEEVKVMDMLSWVMSRTCEDIEDHIPHWIQQGVDYHNRKAVDFTASSSEEGIQHLKKAWLQPAARSLDDMYGLLDAESSSMDAISDIPDMGHRLKELGITVIRDTRMEEEQEREVSHELEEERQVERPPKIKPAMHRLDKEVREFVQNGIIPTMLDVLFPLMTPLRTSSEKLSPPNPWSKVLLCTRDFMTTTQDGGEKSMLTSYLRPVQWILSHTRGDGRMVLVVMSPYEVNLLLQDIRTSKHVRLHMYAPRTTQAMKPLDDLMFYCIPPLPQGDSDWTPPSLDVRCQLNIWGGQLYLDKYETYLHLCLLLGISSSESDLHASVESDRFVPESGRVGDMKQICLFDKSPITLLKMLFSLRRKGMSYDLTHMGKILSARLVFPKDFEEYTRGERRNTV